jgi:hypothetical protein
VTSAAHAVTDPGPVALALLVLAALAAGWVDAVVGGGGLLQLPALLIGLPGAVPQQVLATNKLASICGTTVSAVTYARRIRPPWRAVGLMAGAALVGSAGGAAMSGLLPVRVFRPLVLVLMVAVAAYTWWRPELGRHDLPPRTGGRHLAGVALAGAVIGGYDGLFGPGTGSFLVFSLVSLFGYAFLPASATAKWVNVATNLGALLVFVPAGAPLWRVGLAMGAANLTGGWLGARTAVARGSGFVRAVFLVVVAALVLRLGYDVLRGA